MAETTTGGIAFEFKHRDSGNTKPNKATPFNLLILGNFSGTPFEQREQFTPIKQRPWYRIDCDDIDDVMSQVEPRLTLETQNDAPYLFTPSNLDDFHPDALYENFPPFATLRQLRRQLNNNETFAEAASKLEQWLGIETAEPSNKPAQSSTVSESSSSEGLLDSILDNSNQVSATTLSNERSANAWLRQLVDDAVAPYTLPGKDPRKEDYLALLDQSISDLMRSLLHNPAFKALEAHWRGLDFILRRVDNEARLNIYICDITKEELLADLAQQSDATQSDFYQRIDQQFAGSEEQLCAITTTFEFSNKKQDALMLGIIAKLCTKLDCPFIGNGNSDLAHCDNFFNSDDFRDWNQSWDKDFAQTWQAVRNMPESHYICLTAPRFLIRYPYSTDHYSIDSFQFNELPAQHSNSNDLPWAPGAFAVAAILGQTFNEQGWQMQLGSLTELHRLPIAFFNDAGDKAVIPNGECFLTEAMFNRLCDAGLTPIVGVKNSDSLKVGPILGLHERSPLLGPWI